MSRDTVATMDTILNFGKHKGRKVRNVVQDDPDYLAWAADTIEWFSLDDEVEMAVQEALS